MGVPYLFYEVIEGGHGSGANLARTRFLTSALEMTLFGAKADELNGGLEERRPFT